MKKLYFGFTKGQLSIIMILAIGIILGLMVKIIPLWDEHTVFLKYQKDSTYLAKRFERDKKPILYNSQETVNKFIDSISQKSLPKTILVEKININNASVEELTTLPGIGEKIASKIIEYRKNHGNFLSEKDLQKVHGIGFKKFKKIKPLISL